MLAGGCLPSLWRSRGRSCQLRLGIRLKGLVSASDDLSTLLSKADQSLTLKILLDTLQQTIEFESSMSKKWATPVCIPFTMFQLDAFIPRQLDELLKATSLPTTPARTMSSAFEPHLGIFVEAQDKSVHSSIHLLQLLILRHQSTRRYA